MRGLAFSKEQAIYALRQAEADRSAHGADHEQ